MSDGHIIFGFEFHDRGSVVFFYLSMIDFSTEILVFPCIIKHDNSETMFENEFNV